MARALDRPSLYDTDYVAWLEEQVAHLRAGRLAALDVENVALELQSIMNSQRQQLENRLEVLIHHLLKWDHQPDQRCKPLARHGPRAADAHPTPPGRQPEPEA